jgi:hypothetical protein
MMLAGSLLAAIAETRACRSMWGWAASRTVARGVSEVVPRGSAEV